MSKSKVAAEATRRFNPRVTVDDRHCSVMHEDYNKDFFKRFDLVLNALDNVPARNHVNRLCLAANVPLVESGTKG